MKNKNRFIVKESKLQSEKVYEIIDVTRGCVTVYVTVDLEDAKNKIKTMVENLK